MVGVVQYFFEYDNLCRELIIFLVHRPSFVSSVTICDYRYPITFTKLLVNVVLSLDLLRLVEETLLCGKGGFICDSLEVRVLPISVMSQVIL